MSKRKIFSIGFLVPNEHVKNLSYHSDHSLLDADIVLFQPGIGEYSGDEYQGKPLLSQRGSFRARESLAHWKTELLEALTSGKLVIIFLAKPDEVYAHIGKQEYSGTGRNRLTTNYVDLLNSYQALPLKFSRVISGRGEVIKPSANLRFLASYWKEFGSISSYQVYLEGDFSDVLLMTKTGNKVVGAVVKHGTGTLLLLPPIQSDYNEEEFVEDDAAEESETDEESWTKEALSFGARLVTSLVGIDQAIRAEREVTPPPQWTQAELYRLIHEAELEAQITEISNKIEQLQDSHSDLITALASEGSLRRLLFEQGSELEDAILDALRYLGFSAERLNEDGSEFDAVFVSAEGRFFGEAEGKDNKAVNIDKLSQLERNLGEDFQREEITEYAKGVLFGNAFRLTSLEERGLYFTDKCLAGAKRIGAALIRTPDLFIAAKYLKENADADYAQLCREVIFSTSGEIVVFPLSPPTNLSDEYV